MKAINQFNKALPHIQQVLAEAQKTIKERTGFDVVLLPKLKTVNDEELAEQLLLSMCEKWGVDRIAFVNSGRDYPWPEMRKVFWMSVSIHYPRVSLKYKAYMVGVDNHATVINGIKRGFEMLAMQDKKFMAVYEPVKEFFL